MKISGLKNRYISVHVCMTIMMNSRLWEKIYSKTIQKCTITLSVGPSVRVGFTEHHIYLSIIGLYNCF